MAELTSIQIISTPDILGGKPRIEGRRISVQLVAVLHEHAGRSIHEIAAELNLSLAEIYAALSYYHANREEIEEAIRLEDRRINESSDVVHIKADDLIRGDLNLVMTPQEIAETYDVTPDAVYQAVKRDTIPYRKSGSTILIRRWDAEKRWRAKSNRGRPRRAS
jgi:uncharacterized protein (DUF433 family)